MEDWIQVDVAVVGGGLAGLVAANRAAEQGAHVAVFEAGVAHFCDIRARRGVRGPEYAFANSRRLQDRLRTLGVAYSHRPDLAPSASLRSALAEADAAAGVRRRARTRLDVGFADAYAAERLSGLDAASFLAAATAVGPVCLFCVEREPAACHRT